MTAFARYEVEDGRLSFDCDGGVAFHSVERTGGEYSLYFPRRCD